MEKPSRYRLNQLIKVNIARNVILKWCQWSNKGRNTKSWSLHYSNKKCNKNCQGQLFFFLIYILFYFFLILFFNFTILYWFCHIKMNPPQVYMCSPSWTLLPPPSPCHPSGSSQCTSPKHPVSCIEQPPVFLRSSSHSGTSIFSSWCWLNILEIHIWLFCVFCYFWMVFVVYVFSYYEFINFYF